MPGAVPHTSTVALTNSTLKYGLMLAELGVEGAVKADRGLARGLNVYDGKVTNANVAAALGLPFADPLEAVS